MNSFEGPFFKGSTLTYRTQAGFSITLRPALFFAGSAGDCNGSA